MAKKQKYYVVWRGHTTGIFNNWQDCQQQIKGYHGAKYKSFTSLSEAETAFSSNYADYIGGGAKKAKPKATIGMGGTNIPVWKSIAVDAACSGNPGILEYQGVDTTTQKTLFRMGPFPNGTQNIGEFLAIVHGLAYLKQHNIVLPLYTDSRTAMAWVRNKKIKTTLARTTGNRNLFTLVDRAIKWLNNNSYNTEILKWDTKSWGEIPADFGRK